MAAHRANEAAWSSFSAFLAEVLGSHSPLEASPKDVVFFLVDLDLRGSSRSVLHASSCPLFRNPAASASPAPTSACGCPTRLLPATVRGHRYSLQAAFRDRGRVSPFDPQTRLGNPCIAAEVDRYINALDNERADAGSAMGAPTRQAVSPSQLHLLLAAAMDECRRLVSVEPLAAFRALRDALFFSLSWATMDRGCDLLELHLSQIVTSVSPSGLAQWTIHRARSKTARSATNLPPPVILVAQPPSSPSYRFCPVLLLPGLLSLGTRLGVDLSVGPLFRAVRLRPARGVPPSILDTAATTAMLRDRLAALCDAASLPRLALHAFRRGRARALRAEGASDGALRALGGWKTQQMVSWYADEHGSPVSARLPPAPSSSRE
jgi:integrase